MGPSVSDYEKYNHPTPKPSDNVMYLADVLFELKMSQATLYRKIAAGEVPKHTQKIDNKSAWRRDEIMKYSEKRFAAFK